MNFFATLCRQLNLDEVKSMLKLPASHSPAVSENDQPLLY